jgi:PKD repeat protein
MKKCVFLCLMLFPCLANAQTKGEFTDTKNEKVYPRYTLLKSDGSSLMYFMDCPFTVTSSGLPGVDGPITKWGDYDNDGDMDLYLCGYWVYPDGISDIHRNNGDGTFTPLGEAFETVEGSADWGDFDCDGDLDLLIAGKYKLTQSYITRLYRNDGEGLFINYPIDVPGGFLAKWGDYDNDGDPDILINEGDENSYNIELYENNGTGTYHRTDIYFEKAETDFISLSLSSFDWGDYNNDGFPDIVVSGQDDIDNKYCKIYKNNGNKTFTDLELMLKGNSMGRVNWGDFDNDNDLDILLSGSYYKDVLLFRNEGNDVFSNFHTDFVTGQEINSWIDANNDGNLDIILSGLSNSGIYAGDGKGSFEHLPCTLANIQHADIDIADYDNDNDLDFVNAGYSSGLYTQVYKNNTAIVNHAPSLPTGLTARQNGADVVFSWYPATDSENGENLSYNITAGTSPDNCIIISPLSDLSSGKRLKLNRGNVGNDTSWILKNAPLGMLYWSVQSIDRTLKSSAFAAFRSFEVKTPFSGMYIADASYNVSVTGSSFIDMNNDGLLDILLSGSHPSNSTKEVDCFINQGNNTFARGTISGSKLVGEFIPCNLNGDSYMDALICGSEIINSTPRKIYELINNKSGGFIVSIGDFAGYQSWALTAGDSRVLSTGDFDNDGDEDIVFFGSKMDTSSTYFPGTFLFKKENSGYTVHDLGCRFDLPDQPISACDVDNDLDLDIVYGPHILLNDSIFVRKDVFPFKDVRSIDWGDFDGDGDLDAALTGLDTIDNHVTRIYENLGNLKFSPLKIKIQAFVNHGFVRWLDFNNDGLLDLTISGSKDGSHVFIYLNQGNSSFKETDYPDRHASDWGDFDNDGDLDILDGSWVNISNAAGINNPAHAPSGLTCKLDGFDVVLSWDKAWDDENKNSNGLSYNVKVGTSKGSYDVMQVLTAADGQLRIPRIGNVQTNTSWRLKNLPMGNYHWSVQAVDQGYKGGSWAEEKSFKIGNVFVDFTYDTVCFGDPTTFTDQSLSREGPILAWKWDFKDGETSDKQNPVHFFSRPGEFDVKLTIALNTGSYEKTNWVIVKPKPVADFSYEVVSEEGEILRFDNQTDTSGIEVAEWKWDFGDSTVFRVKDPPQHGYRSTGIYTVKLSVISSEGCSDSLSKVIHICHGMLKKPELYAFGPNLWYLVCSNDTAKYYNWYYDGHEIPNEGTYIYVANQNLGEYRVDISNDDECYISSDVVSIPPTGELTTENQDKNIIYPNPAQEKIRILYSDSYQGNILIRIISADGTAVKELKMIKSHAEFSEELDLTGFEPGFYILELLTKHFTMRNTFIIMK